LAKFHGNILSQSQSIAKFLGVGGLLTFLTRTVGESWSFTNRHRDATKRITTPRPQHGW